MKKLLLTLVLVFSINTFLRATEGMWIPLLLSANEAEMKAMGLQLTAEDIYSINKSSLKDAIVHFGGFCTGEVISNKGLVLTNHHCGYGQIQNHSSVEKDYLKNGFWAMNNAEELQNPGLFVDFLRYMEEVTNEVLQGVHEGLSAKEREEIILNNSRGIIQKKKSEKELLYNIRAFFNGNRYFLLAAERYPDVRLVGAPPSSIGKFGADTDNWVWPRHTGDFSIFRIYTDKNNRPAQPNAANVPYVPETFLSINIKPKKEGDFTMVFGYPGRTELFLPASAVDQIVNITTPVRINIRETRLKLLDARMRESDEMRIKYASTYASVSNAWKKWIGQNIGIKETKGIEVKRQYEEEFNKRLSAEHSLNVKYGSILPEMNKLYAELEPYNLARDYFIEAAFSGIEIVKYASRYRALVAAYSGGENADVLKNRAMALANGANDFYKNFSAEADAEGMAALLDIYLNQPKHPNGTTFIPNGWAGKKTGAAIAKATFAKSLFARPDAAAYIKQMAEKNPAELAKKIVKDPAYVLMTTLFEAYATKVEPEYNRINNQLEALQKTYTQAQIEVFKEKNFYPDANSTLRLTYGVVEGFAPRDGMRYDHQTYMEGIMQKYVPGDYEFDLPVKLIDLYNKKDFGKYGENGRMPVCFIASNHTSGGNSGSPALNGKGELVGLNFDRVWEGTMSDLYFDRSRCRNIMVDSRYILFVVDKFAGAGYLLDEMKIVE